MVDDPDPWKDPGWLEYAEHVKAELIPMIKDSAVTLSIVPSDNKPDPKFAVELGYMIMLDKPIIAIVNPGSKVPLKLAKVADEIVEGAPGDPDFEKRLMAAMDRVRKKIEKRNKWRGEK